jgi:hypothetical protein
MADKEFSCNDDDFKPATHSSGEHDRSGKVTYRHGK